MGMQEDGLDIEKMETKAKEFTLAGDYRRIKATADDLSWEEVKYRDPYADLQASDRDALAGRTSTQCDPLFVSILSSCVCVLSLCPSCLCARVSRARRVIEKYETGEGLGVPAATCASSRTSWWQANAAMMWKGARGCVCVCEREGEMEAWQGGQRRRSIQKHRKFRQRTGNSTKAHGGWGREAE
jgi:hypothetical protein